MANVKLNNMEFEPYIKYGEIKKSIDRIAKRINADYKGAKDVPVILCVLNGAMMFTSELMKRFKFDCELATIRMSSYQGTSSTGIMRKVLGLTTHVKGRRVIVVEDIVDTGATVASLVEILREKGASEVKICTMLHKPAIYKGSIKLDYVAMEVAPKFILGFGLDYNEMGRNYKDIYTLKQ